jgi:peptide/nickel transport system permease protein
MTSRLQFLISVSCLAAIHIAALLAGFLAPYDYAAQDRELPFAPPSKVHLVDMTGRLHWPFVYRQTEEPGDLRAYQEVNDRRYPIRVFVKGDTGTLFGFMATDHHLFGVDQPARISLMGTDGYGRDVFSRLVYGSQISLFAGLLAATLSLIGGTALGVLAGFFGGWLDAAVMRCAELFLALPWLYLLFAVRAFLPLHIRPAQAFALVIAVIGIVGWARPARLVRGVALSARERGYVLAAKGFGASNLYLMRRHILPQALGVVFTQAALLIPQYILAEVMLSFLGLGIGEPMPSWGSMLASLQQYHVLVSCWWMLFPGFALIPIFLSYQQLSQILHERFL